MHINWQHIFDLAIVVITLLLTWFNRISKIILPILAAVEKAAQDGIINKNERKEIAMEAINSALVAKQIKLNFVERVFISWLVDIIAKKLPDFNVTMKTKELLSDVDYRFNK